MVPSRFSTFLNFHVLDLDPLILQARPLKDLMFNWRLYLSHSFLNRQLVTINPAFTTCQQLLTYWHSYQLMLLSHSC